MFFSNLAKITMDFIKRQAPAFPFYKLESESSTVSNEDTESICSSQEIETDIVHDTSDTEHQEEYEVEIEYEVDSVSDCDTASLIDSSDVSDMERGMVLAAAAVICDSSFEKWVTDGEDSDLSSSDNSFNRTDFWTCVKCKSQNNNPLFRYCKKCFQARKTLFPPRPRPKKPKKIKNQDSTVKLESLQSCLSGLSQLSQDSGIGSSQECPQLGLDKIVIPQHLTKNSNAVTSKSSAADEDVIPSSQLTSETICAPSTSKRQRRKRQISESSFSESELKRPRWKDVKKSPQRECKSNTVSPNRLHSDNNANSDKLTQEPINLCGKTSDLGSEISSGSGSGIFDKAEDTKDSVMESKEMCIFCNSTPKNAIFLHGSIAHMCCCYKCAKKTWRTIKRCPICNRKVNNVVRVYKT